MASGRLQRLHPEPGRLWISWSPRTWRCAEGLWTDLASGRLVGFRGAPELELPAIDLHPVDDLLYLPPVSSALAGERDRLAAEAVAAGLPVLVQRVPGEADEVPGTWTAWDLSATLTAGDAASLERLPPGGAAIWPLIPGISDSDELQRAGCEMLAGAGVRCVRPVAVEIDPVVRRCLVEEKGDEAVFRALFHGPPVSERAFARRAAEHGLEIFSERPPLGGRRQRSNRRIVAVLALAGDLWLRLGRPESAGQALLQAARNGDATGYDLAALAREGNLGVMEWLDENGAALVTDIASGREPALLDELLGEYLEG